MRVVERGILLIVTKESGAGKTGDVREGSEDGWY